jgi:hypothetical protein
MQEQLTNAREQKEGDLAGLLGSGDTWTIS